MNKVLASKQEYLLPFGLHIRLWHPQSRAIQNFSIWSSREVGGRKTLILREKWIANYFLNFVYFDPECIRIAKWSIRRIRTFWMIFYSNSYLHTHVNLSSALGKTKRRWWVSSNWVGIRPSGRIFQLKLRYGESGIRNRVHVNDAERHAEKQRWKSAWVGPK